MEKVTVIGGSGFIGTRFCQSLQDQGILFEIIDLVESQTFPEHTVIADIRDLDALRAAVSGSKIVHLAAVHRDDVKPLELYTHTNVDGTRNVAAVASEKGIKVLVFTSTVAVYGFAPQNTCEDGKMNPFNEYGRTKLGAEHVLHDWKQQGGDDASLVIVRPTVVFGERNRGNVYNLLKQIHSGRFIMIGSGKNRKSMAYVGNIVEFLRASLDLGNGTHVYNYVDKPDLDMNHLVSHVRGKLAQKSGVGPRLPRSVGMVLGSAADIVAAVTGKSLPISRVRIQKFTGTTQFGTAAHDVLGFTAPYTLDEGLERTLEADFLGKGSQDPIFYTE